MCTRTESRCTHCVHGLVTGPIRCRLQFLILTFQRLIHALPKRYLQQKKNVTDSSCNALNILVRQHKANHSA